jgi:hypothetical protein
VTDDSDQVTMTACLDAEHAEAILGVVKRNPLDQAGKDLLRRRRWRGLHPVSVSPVRS